MGRPGKYRIMVSKVKLSVGKKPGRKQMSSKSGTEWENIWRYTEGEGSNILNLHNTQPRIGYTSLCKFYFIFII